LCGTTVSGSTFRNSRPRVCGNSVEHGRTRNDVLPQGRLQDRVPARATTYQPLRKLFSADSQNWSFHTASAHSRQLALLYAARTRSPKPPFEQRCSNIPIAAIPGSNVATMQHASTNRQRLARPLPGGMLALPGARGCLIDFYLTSVEAEVEGRASTWGASKNHNLT
jgi:hypothetical protein